MTIYVNGWYGQGVYQADDVVLDGAPGQGQPPAAPTGLTGTGNATTASLSWSASSGATGYNVYRNGTRVATATGTTFSETPGTGTHSYQVSATNASGESAQVGRGLGDGRHRPAAAPGRAFGAGRHRQRHERLAEVERLLGRDRLQRLPQRDEGGHAHRGLLHRHSRARGRTATR